MPEGVELAVAYVTLAVEGSKVRKGVNDSLRGTEQDAATSGKRAAKNYSSGFSATAKGALAGVGLAAGIGEAFQFLGDANDEAREAQKVGAQTAAVIKSTGGVAKVSAKDFGDLAGAISAKTGIDDEQIQSSENLLATFTNLRNETGKGNDIFNQATRAAVDLGVALKTGPDAAAQQLGKALNDPSKGYARLQKSGVTFTDSQVKQIKTLQKSGDILGAQKVILGELAKEFGGSAAAQATQADKTEVAIGNLKEQIGTGLLPVQDKLLKLTANKLVPAVSTFVDGMDKGTGAGGRFADGLSDVYGVGKKVAGTIDGLPGPLKSTAAQAGLAYLAFAKFGPGLTSSITGLRTFTTGMTNASTRAASTAAATARLSSAAKTAGGVGGMLLLYNSTKQTNKSLGTMSGLAGGALFGFAVGGVPGAAVGAVAGAFAGLYTSTKNSGNEFKRSSDQAQAYAATLDQVSGAAKGATKSQILLDLTKNKTLQAGLDAGLTRKTLVDAALGKPAAIKAVRDAMSALNGEIDRNKKFLKDSDKISKSLTTRDIQDRLKAKNATDDQQDSLRRLSSLVGEQAASYANDAKNTRLDTAAKLSHKQLLASFPAALVTKIETPGFKQSRDQVISLGRAYKLQPDKLVTLARLQGYDLTVKQAANLLEGYKKIKGPVNAKANLDDKAARRTGDALKRYLDGLAKTRYVHYQVINPSVNKPKVGASGQTGAGRFATERTAAPVAAPTTGGGSRVALTITGSSYLRWG